MCTKSDLAPLFNTKSNNEEIHPVSPLFDRSFSRTTLKILVSDFFWILDSLEIDWILTGIPSVLGFFLFLFSRTSSKASLKNTR